MTEETTELRDTEIRAEPLADALDDLNEDAVRTGEKAMGVSDGVIIVGDGHPDSDVYVYDTELLTATELVTIGNIADALPSPSPAEVLAEELAKLFDDLTDVGERTEAAGYYAHIPDDKLDAALELIDTRNRDGMVDSVDEPVENSPISIDRLEPTGWGDKAMYVAWSDVDE